MKQILLVLVLLAAALGGFFAVRLLNKPATPNANQANRGTGTPQAPNVQLPNSGLNPGGIRRVTPNRVPGRPSPVRTVEWKSMASPDSVVPWTEGWRLDLEQVDLEGDIVVTVGDVEITQADLRRMVCLEVLRNYNLGVFSEAIAEAQSLARGNPYTLDDTLYEQILERQAMKDGMTVAERRSGLAMQSMLPPDLAEKTHRAMLASLVYNVVGGAVDELPTMILAAMRQASPVGPDGERYEDSSDKSIISTLVKLREVWQRLNSAESYDDRETDLDQIAALLQLQTVFQQGARNRDLGLLCWSFLDQEAMDDDVYMRVSVAPIDSEEEPIAPWLHGGEVIDLRVSDVWPSIGEYIDEVKVQEVLEALVWYRVVRASLEEQNVLDSDEEAFAVAAAQHLSLVGALNDSIFTSQSQGYPTLHHFRVAERFMRCHRALLEDGWDSAETQREFFEDNRFFVERWNPQLEFAYFPALDFEAETNQWSVDWDRALESAQSMKGRVALGQDFRQLVKSHTDSLTRTIGEKFGEEYQSLYADRARGGVLSNTLREVEDRVGETAYQEMLRGTSFVKHIAAHSNVGEVVGPLRISGGYALARLSSAQLDALERDWEDARELCEYYFLRSRFLQWSNARLASQ